MNTEFSHARRLPKKPPQNSIDRALLNYYGAQYRYSLSQLGKATTAKDAQGISKAMTRLNKFRNLRLDLMLKLRTDQLAAKSKRQMQEFKQSIFNHAKAAAGVI